MRVALKVGHLMSALRKIRSYRISFDNQQNGMPLLFVKQLPEATRRFDYDATYIGRGVPMGTDLDTTHEVRDHRPKSITRICRRASIKTELFRLEDHLLHIPRQDVSGDVPMRLDVSAVGPTNRVGHRVCDKLPQRPQS
jgi:hypothetical protein